jgi:phage FluMu protein Com
VNELILDTHWFEEGVGRIGVVLVLDEESALRAYIGSVPDDMWGGSEEVAARVIVDRGAPVPWAMRNALFPASCGALRPASYVILKDPFGTQAIRCLMCGKVSANRSDIRERYCGHCKQFHGNAPHVEVPTRGGRIGL